MSEPIGPTAIHRRRFLTADQALVDPFRPLEPNCSVIQFNRPLTSYQLQQAAGLIAERPDVELYVYGRASKNLDFLSYFQTVRRLHIALYELDDISGFCHVQELEELTFGQTKKTFSLHFIEGLPRLRKLFLAGHKKDLHAICRRDELTSLGLSGITLPDLSLLLPSSSKPIRICTSATPPFAARRPAVSGWSIFPR